MSKTPLSSLPLPASAAAGGYDVKGVALKIPLKVQAPSESELYSACGQDESFAEKVPEVGINHSTLLTSLAVQSTPLATKSR
jgi:hypothetical protein